MKPNYLVIGASKCATSSLCYLLGCHPDVFMTTPKEPHFFSYSEVWAKGWDWYELLFSGAEEKKAVGEGSTTYTMKGRYPDAAPRIACCLPEARLIYIVRDPLARMESHWMHLRAREGREELPFGLAVRRNPWYIDTSLYNRQITAYRERLTGEIVRKIRAAGDVQRIVETAAQELGQALGVSRAHIRLADPMDGSPLPQDPERTPTPRQTAADAGSGSDPVREDDAG